MPQLDIVTFTGQIFWLFVVFFVFYSIVLKQILPMLARILKTRQKKLDNSRMSTDQFGEENADTANAYANLVVSSLTEATDSAKEHAAVSNNWISESNKALQLDALKSSNVAFLNSVKQTTLEAKYINNLV